MSCTGWSPDGRSTAPRCGSRPACCDATPSSCPWPASRRSTSSNRSRRASSGLAELRIRVAGAKAAHHLSYLSEPEASDLRARLLAVHHGLDQSVPEPDERPVAVIPTGRLLGSVLLSASTLGALVFVALLAVLSSVSTAAAAAVAGSLLVYLIGIGQGIWRRFNEQYQFTVALAPDGIRVRRGLLSTVSETIPIRRVQAVRQIEPLLWRLFGWCRLEVDLAGMPGHGRSSGGGRVTKALLPVGPYQSAAVLRQVVIGSIEPPSSEPPRRARLKAPLSYHFLAAGHDGGMAVAVTGRVQRVTCWVPLEKAQSVRRVQGPVQRALHLATVHVDVAGRRGRGQVPGPCRRRGRQACRGAGRPRPGGTAPGVGRERARRGEEWVWICGRSRPCRRAAGGGTGMVRRPGRSPSGPVLRRQGLDRARRRRGCHLRRPALRTAPRSKTRPAIGIKRAATRSSSPPLRRTCPCGTTPADVPSWRRATGRRPRRACRHSR